MGSHHSRDLLHHTKVPDFIAFAESEGCRVEPVRGDFEVLRLRTPDKRLLIFHKRSRTEHLTVPDGAGGLVRRFVRRSK